MGNKLVLHYEDLCYRGTYDVNFPYGATYPEQQEGECLIDYDYEIIVDDELISEYITEQLIGGWVWKTWSKEKQEGFMSALHYCEQMNLFCDMDFNNEFYEWCLDRFKEEAQKQCHLDYDE